jgi:murein L,D-transpeptidase YafK
MRGEAVEFPGTVRAITGVSFVVIVGLFMTTVCSQIMQSERTPRSAELSEPNVVIRKKERVLELYDADRLIKTYKMALGFAPVGDKEKEGDGKTPEGEFYVFTKNPKSRFHLSLGLSYPSVEDAKRGLADGTVSRQEHDAIVSAIEKREMPPQKTALGGEIYIHGGGAESDWTWGCVALKNEDIEEIYKALKPGVRVLILP